MTKKKTGPPVTPRLVTTTTSTVSLRVEGSSVTDISDFVSEAYRLAGERGELVDAGRISVSNDYCITPALTAEVQPFLTYTLIEESSK